MAIQNFKNMKKNAVGIGEMRQRITFQKKLPTPDGYAGHAVIWQDVVTVWASISPLSGREYFYAHQIKAEITHRIKTRYRTDVTAEMRIKYGERRFKIESIIDLGERHEFLEMLCREEK